VRLAKAGVAVPPGKVPFEKLEWETQQLILELHSGDVEVLADFAPQVIANVAGYLERVFDLLSSSEELLVKMGDGLDEQEQLASGWNKVANRLLCAVRERIKGGNVLHTSEQLVLFARCEGRADNANSALLADMMESKYIDPLHIAPLVNYVLSSSKFHKQVRDSALRAMARLGTEDRDALHKRLLDTSKKLPLQVLFSLVVSVLNKQVVPLVLKQLGLLAAEDWEELLVLIRDANPKQGRVHTFPRSLRSTFNERFLVRYLADKQRDVRLFLLFAACTDSDRLPAYLIDVLARQLHALDDTFLAALSFQSSEEDLQLGLEVQNTPLSAEHFRELIEYIQPSEWRSRLGWILTRVRDSPQPEVLLRLVVELLGRKAFRGLAPELLKGAMQWGDQGRAGELLRRRELRAVLHGALPQHASEQDRSLWVTFFQQSWAVGMPAAAERAAEVAAVLDLEKKPLARAEVAALGVDLPSWKLLVQLAPAHAIPLHGFAILTEEPAFARELSDQQFAQITQLQPQDDKLWPLFRSLIAEVEPDRALGLAIALLKHSKEVRDIELVKRAYHAADSFTRKQTCLRTQLAPLWKKFGAKIQSEVIDEISCGSSMSAAISGFKPTDVSGA